MLGDPDFNNQLNKCGIKNARQFIDKQIVRIDARKHDLIHSNKWNDQWKGWLRNKKYNFTKKELMEKVKSMMKDHNIPKSSRNFTRKYKTNGPTPFRIR